jgi:hypothetical protein
MSKRNLKTKTAKWRVKELKIRWYCRNCYQKGLAGISSTGSPTREETLKMITVACHYLCGKPDIRLNYDTTSKMIH